MERSRLSASGRFAAAAGIVAMLTLSACSAPAPAAQSTPSASNAASSKAPAAEDASSSASASPSTSTSTSTGTGGAYGQYASMSEACIAVSASLLSVTILPMAAITGGDPAEVQKAKDELSKAQGKVPEELKPAFEKLRNFTESAGSDLTKYGDGQFEELMKPIPAWVEKNCA
ncbi:hypothetical protein [Paenarthrobacter sp. AB444]|uniref:hypothetical protein n=1 Tax=Paenarthrobacter sp. AB444 TaxID=3025681 RepID=UPI0023671C9B|nr:hypothetical protein [Paenarthrobacter sp. AB444]MDD7834687.1 hypothetical protein [Paenarthrobacter sp. AB444]